MSRIRAILFDFGGTLYDYKSIAPGDGESLLELVRSAGVQAEPAAIHRAHREGMRRAFREYLPKPFYYHRDLFRDAVRIMGEELGLSITEEQLDRHFRRQWELHARDFELREGVPETLRAIRRAGLHLGIVSNIDDDQLAHMGSLARLGDHFDSILSSEAVQSCKPDARIFTEALRRAGCAPDEALFVGDSIDQDIAGANRAGLVSVLLWHREDVALPDRDPRPRHVIRRIPEILGLLDGSAA